MITAIELQNFKSHQHSHVELGALTLLCGQNGVGKSSIIQSLLLLRQSHKLGRLNEGLELNGVLIEVGTIKDILFYNADSRHINIKLLLDSENEIGFTFNTDLGESISNFLPADSQNQNTQNLWQDCSLFKPNAFQYLGANRTSHSYLKKDYDVTRDRQISFERGQGELVAHFLHHYGEESVENTLLNGNESDNRLLQQTIAWEREISSNLVIEVVPNASIGYDIFYSFITQNGRRTTPKFQSNNVGFGIGYTLPLIVAILSAKPGSILLIENPEAHLHPYGQAKVAELMCLAANAGIQLIVETHSDHIINGTLVALKEGKIDHDKIKIHYIDRDEVAHKAVIKEVTVTEKARLRNKPSGFFDQLDKDIDILIS